MDQIESCVPPGFRFHPTEEELVGFYLKKKVNSLKFDIDVINDIDLYRMEPWDIQDKCKLGYDEQNEWYFFSYKDRKYPTGTRTNRATRAGFWKATGRDKAVLSKNNIIGMRKTLVFYKGRAPNGNKSDWIMHEYRLQTSEHAPPQEEGWVVCRAFKKPTPSHAKQGLGAWNHPNSNYYYMRENTYNNNHHARSIANMSSPTNNINQLTDHNTNSYHPHQQQAMQPFGNFEQELISTNNNNNNNSAIDLIENQFLIDLPRLDSPSLSPSLAATKEASDHHQQDGGVINHKDYDIEKSNGNNNNNNNNNKWEILDCFLASQIPHETQASFFYSNPQSLRLVPCDYELEAHNQEANFLGSCFHNL